MTRPTKFDLMRARRARKWDHKPTRERIVTEIDHIEADMERKWAALSASQPRADFDDTRDWLADTRKQAHEKVGYEPEPSLARVVLRMAANFTRRLCRRGA